VSFAWQAAKEKKNPHVQVSDLMFIYLPRLGSFHLVPFSSPLCWVVCFIDDWQVFFFIIDLMA
jgi:hypothetical protein